MLLVLLGLLGLLVLLVLLVLLETKKAGAETPAMAGKTNFG